MPARQSLIALLFALAVATPAFAGQYYNSAEPGCGSDPNVLACEDFEHNQTGGTPGTWFLVAGDIGFDDPRNKGWMASLSACGFEGCTGISPAGAAQCGAGVTPFGNCAGSGGTKTSGTGSINQAMHRLKTSTCGSTGREQCGVNEVYVRWYAKWAAGFSFGGEKHLNVTNYDGDIAFANVQLNCGAGGAFSEATPFIQVLHGLNVCQSPNVSGISILSGRWYFFEFHVRVGASGLMELWINDCGTAGTACGASPVLRTTLSGNLPGNCAAPGVNNRPGCNQIQTIWLENWANPGSVGTGPLWDQFKVSRVGPIGFSGAAPPTAFGLPGGAGAATYNTTGAIVGLPTPLPGPTLIGFVHRALLPTLVVALITLLLYRRRRNHVEP